MINRDNIDSARSESSDLDASAPLSEYLRYDREQKGANVGGYQNAVTHRQGCADLIALRHIKETLIASKRSNRVVAPDEHIAREHTARVDYPYYDQTQEFVQTCRQDMTGKVVANSQIHDVSPQNASEESVGWHSTAFQNAVLSLSPNENHTDASNMPSSTDIQLAPLDEQNFEFDLSPRFGEQIDKSVNLGNLRRLNASKRSKTNMPILSRFVELVDQVRASGADREVDMSPNSSATSVIDSLPSVGTKVFDGATSPSGVTVALAIAPEYLADSTLVGVFEDGAL